MQYVIECENIKCGGCANTIESKLKSLDGVDSATVVVEEGAVTVEGQENLRELIIETLLSSGYPEIGSVEGLKAAGAKAKSFVSCAIGRVKA